MDDLTAQVSQQATLMLGTIHDAALKSVMSCLEYQFDTGEFLNVSLFRNVFLVSSILQKNRTEKFDFTTMVP